MLAPDLHIHASRKSDPIVPNAQRGHAHAAGVREKVRIDSEYLSICLSHPLISLYIHTHRYSLRRTGPPQVRPYLCTACGHLIVAARPVSNELIPCSPYEGDQSHFIRGCERLLQVTGARGVLLRQTRVRAGKTRGARAREICAPAVERVVSHTLLSRCFQVAELIRFVDKDMRPIVKNTW